MRSDCTGNQARDELHTFAGNELEWDPYLLRRHGDELCRHCWILARSEKDQRSPYRDEVQELYQCRSASTRESVGDKLIKPPSQSAR